MRRSRVNDAMRTARKALDRMMRREKERFVRREKVQRRGRSPPPRASSGGGDAASSSTTTAATPSSTPSIVPEVSARRTREFVDAAGNINILPVEPEESVGLLRRLVTRYTTAMVEKPILTNALTQGVLCALGDAIAQKGVEKNDTYDVRRTARMATYGLVVAGPLYTVWYRTLDKTSRAFQRSYEPLVTGRFRSFIQAAVATAPVGATPLAWLQRLRTSQPAPISHAHVTGGKVVADGVLGNPMILHAYFASMGVLEGRPPREILESTREKFHNAWGLALLVWTPVQCANFGIVPLHLQAAVVAVVNVGWSTTLSLLNRGQGRGASSVAATSGSGGPPVGLDGSRDAPGVAYADTEARLAAAEAALAARRDAEGELTQLRRENGALRSALALLDDEKVEEAKRRSAKMQRITRENAELRAALDKCHTPAKGWL